MSEEVVTPSFRWSFSQFETYNSCPAKWKFQNVLKLPRSAPGPAAARGLDMHDRAEKYIKGEISLEECQYGDPTKSFGDKKPAKIHEKYIPILDAYRDHPTGDKGCEKKLAFTDGWYLTGSKDPKAACIAVLDAYRFIRPHTTVTGVLEIGEWKSGKPKDTHSDQRKLYAMFGYKAFLADEVRVTTFYLEDTAPPERLVLKSQSGFDKLAAMWDSRIQTMRGDQICAPKPSFGCNWCDFAKSKGGPCQFGN
jgi:hypothetical protein